MLQGAQCVAFRLLSSVVGCVMLVLRGGVHFWLTDR
jgi:hypothetical protein